MHAAKYSESSAIASATNAERSAVRENAGGPLVTWRGPQADLRPYDVHATCRRLLTRAPGPSKRLARRARSRTPCAAWRNHAARGGHR